MAKKSEEISLDKFLNLIDRIARIETKVDNILMGLADIRDSATNMTSRIDKLEEKVSKHSSYINLFLILIGAIITGFIGLLFQLFK